VYTFSGDRRSMVVDDPTGEEITPEIRSRRRARQQDDEIRELKQRLAQLERHQRGQERAAAAIAQGSEPDDDEPDEPYGPGDSPATSTLGQVDGPYDQDTDDIAEDSPQTVRISR
jgi:hypothetical protein